LQYILHVIIFAKTGLFHTKWQGTLFTTTQFLHQWTNDPCVYHSLPMIYWSVFLGLFSWACLSAQVVFKWQWCERTSTHLTGNHCTIGQWAWPLNRLLFVISRANMGLRWDHLGVFNFCAWKTLLLCGFPLP